jgi:hypothetical protein
MQVLHIEPWYKQKYELRASTSWKRYIRSKDMLLKLYFTSIIYIALPKYVHREEYIFRP